MENKKSLRIRLQYAYSLFVFSGVLVTAYMIMNKDTNARLPVTTYAGSSIRAEGALFDPSMNQLFEIETALTKLKKESNQKGIRVPTEIRLNRK